MNNPFDYVPDAECREAFNNLLERVEQLKHSDRQEDINLCNELNAGKMLGVLIAADGYGSHHTLYAFSGQLGSGGFHRAGFVEPVFDYLAPDGHFKTTERKIIAQNLAIEHYEKTVLKDAQEALEYAQNAANDELHRLKEKFRLSKLRRDCIRQKGVADTAELDAMIRQSQFEKAELHRFKKTITTRLEPYKSAVEQAEATLNNLKKKRRDDSENLQNWLFNNSLMLNAKGEQKSISEVFASEAVAVPPSGTGECCAPKLLQAAYRRGLKPLSIAEFWYGRQKEGELRIHGSYYPACRGKCLPILRWMLQGLDISPALTQEYKPTISHEPIIVFYNQHFCIIDKPAGMLSVPGKGDDLSLQHWLEYKFGAERQVKLAHRLDRDTSGLVIATFGQSAYKMMQALFAQRLVKKTYIAVLDGDYQATGLRQRGLIDLPLSADYYNRPRQKVDFDNGKSAVTEYEFLSTNDNQSRVQLRPVTGRTHQLRVHAASDQGLGMPIVGDPLYGKDGGCHRGRLMLHAHKLHFTFPKDGQTYDFESPTPF